MFRNFHKHILFWLGIITVGLIFGSALQIALAWTVPSVAPPGNNVATPLNTGPTAQIKTGSLTVNGTGTFMRAHSFSDLDNTGYYLNPHDNSNLNTADIGELTVGTTIHAHGEIYGDLPIQAPVFIDNDDSDYFINSSDTSNLNHITMDGQLGLGLGGGSVEANRQIDSQGYIKSRTGFCIGNHCIDSWSSGVGIPEGYAITGGAECGYSAFPLGAGKYFSWGAANGGSCVQWGDNTNQANRLPEVISSPTNPNNAYLYQLVCEPGNVSIHIGSRNDASIPSYSEHTWLCAKPAVGGGGGMSFGPWETKQKDTVYQAATDGLVIANGWLYGYDLLEGYTDSSNPPVTKRAFEYASGMILGGADGNSFTMPVKKGDYWKVEMKNVDGRALHEDPEIFWLPILGSGTGGSSGTTGELTIYGTASCPSGFTQAYSGTAYTINKETVGVYVDISNTKCYDDSGGAPFYSSSFGPCKVCLPDSGTYIALKGSGSISCASGWTSVYSGTAGIQSFDNTASGIRYHMAGDVECYQGALPGGVRNAGACNVCFKAGSGGGGDDSWDVPSDVKVTSASHNGNFGSYKAMYDWIQTNGCSGYHVCSGEELSRYYQINNVGTVYGWINSGQHSPRAGTEDDCLGWTSTINTDYGDIWDNSKPGTLTCNNSTPVVCCSGTNAPAPPPPSDYPCTCRLYTYADARGHAVYINCGAGYTMINNFYAPASTAERGPVYYPCSPTEP